MQQVERVGVSVEKGLLAAFDKLITSQGYVNRSEAIRDLIREKISEEQLKNPKIPAVAVVLMVYDHHSSDIPKRLTDLQHSHLLKTISSIHVHINPHDCLEIIILKGKVGEIQKMADKIIALKGVKLGRVNFIPIG